MLAVLTIVTLHQDVAEQDQNAVMSPGLIRSDRHSAYESRAARSRAVRAALRSPRRPRGGAVRRPRPLKALRLNRRPSPRARLGARQTIGFAACVDLAPGGGSDGGRRAYASGRR